jgi:hypothetical protein
MSTHEHDLLDLMFACPEDLVAFLVDELGEEDGDYGRDFFIVCAGGDYFQVRIKGWGAIHIPGAIKPRLITKKMAKEEARGWRELGFEFAGVMDSSDPEVWFLTWAVQPLDPESGAKVWEECPEDWRVEIN